MKQVNKEIVKIQRVNAPAGQMQLKSMIEAHVVRTCNIFFKLLILIFFLLNILGSLKEKTGSQKGAAVLKEWEAYLPLFWQLVPPSEEDSPEACAEFEKVAAARRVPVQSA